MTKGKKQKIILEALSYGIIYKTTKETMAPGYIYKIDEDFVYIFRKMDSDYVRDIKDGTLERTITTFKKLKFDDFGYTWVIHVGDFKE